MRDKVLVIAEAGVNHNGDFGLAKQLVEIAAQSGADYVKFQTFKADKLVTKTARKANYQKKNINGGHQSQYEMLKKLEMPKQWHYDLRNYAKDNGIGFLSTGFDEDSIDFLDKLGLPLFKIPSGDITNKPYLQYIGKKGKPVVISAGMATMGEIEAAIEVLEQAGILRANITVLHCTTEYPTPMSEVNLLAMKAINNAFGVSVGYSDHTRGIEVPIAAVALGACVIEKHFTLDRHLPGPDHQASLEPDELKAMVTAIRNIEIALGDGIKRLTPGEAQNKPFARKSLVAGKAIKSGETFTVRNIIAKRPGLGISPMQWDEVIGRIATRDFEADEMIEL
jgi:N,N'-diacetyllegionaminate synthase